MQKLETDLENRILRFDGVSIIEPELVYDLLLRGVPPSKILINSSTPEVDSFNYQVIEADKIREKKEAPITITSGWELPKEIELLNVDDYVGNLLETFLETSGYHQEQIEIAIERVSDELEEIRNRGLELFIKTVIFIVQSFKETGQIWGVGRGSSCASYVLFLIGVHVVDCVKYNIEMSEFFHD